ncbi:cyclic nucleotide-binding domain-containing protein 1 [Megalops cyprinoides]|uniref:cyclic nucleotide-binding domain-containing protein 1 n=1 Tax=Megalops cyprinoides TaxID=118141 RepID=UPI00186484B6|nr:cyclic nucleotide-binding domain-containing protein 1 [Megalops cyprinoides]
MKALRKLPIDRSQAEQQAIRRMLSTFPSLPAHLSRQELLQISSITVLESWERGQAVFGCSGFYLILKGSVKLLAQEGLKVTAYQKAPTIGVGGCFGTLVQAGVDTDSDLGQAGVVTLCAIAQDACEVLRISQAGYTKLRKEIAAQNSSLRESLIQSCPFYLHWPRLSVKKLASLIQMRILPANQVLVTQGQVCPFVGYIRTGACTVLQDIGALKGKLHGKKGSRARYVVVGTLGEKESFGEVSILLDQPSPCSVVTATEVKMGVILPEALKGMDVVTRSLMVQTAQPMYRKLSQEQIEKEYLTQQRHREWENTKKRVLSDALFYNGIVQGCGKWSLIRGRRQDKCGAPGTLSM